jgi:hypothetical protein
VSWAGDFEVGQTIAIEYDPDNPGHARPLDGWSPTYRTLWLYAAVGLPAAIALAVATRAGLGRDVDVATSRNVHPMHGAAYRSGGWLHRKHLVGLWPEGSDRQAPPPLSVEVEESLGMPRSVTVVGGSRPGDHAVLQAGGDTIWTRGRLKAGIDPKAKPRG